MLQFAMALRAEAPSVFHAHLTWQGACRLGLAAARVLRVPAILATAQLFTHAEDDGGIARYLGSAGVHRYLAVSDAVSRKLHKDLGVSARRIRVVRNGILLARADRSPGEGLRRELQRGMARPIILTLARSMPRKGSSICSRRQPGCLTRCS